MSGDGFAHACDHVPFAKPFLRTDDRSGSTWFVEVGDLEHERGREGLLQLASACDRRPTLVIHNGDRIPPDAFYQQALEVFDRVFSVNLIVEGPRLRAIPIGLENCWHRTPDESGEYLYALSSGTDAEKELVSRPDCWFASFRVATNPGARRDLERRLQRVGVTNDLIDRSTYRARVRRARFVLSPPGNGPDCHRTWEGVYLGAVPVVLRNSIAPGVVSGARVVVVDDWDEVLGLDEGELSALYLDVRSRPLAPSLMPHWLETIGAGSMIGV